MRQRWTAAAIAALIAGAGLVVALDRGGHTARAGAPGSGPPPTGSAPGSSASHPAPSASGPPFAVGLRILTLVDRSRQVQLPGRGLGPRSLTTVVRYPASGPASARPRIGAPPDAAAGPFPLVVFGHGFALTQADYAGLLESWTRAGYVVAAPAFPLERADAPGGPDESDLANQPRDMSFVISRLLAQSASASGPLSHLINPGEVAVAGHSDGGDTALSVAYDPQFRDRRVRAAVILSGAEIPGREGFAFPPAGPPLLASQGTADTVNLPSSTAAFFGPARRPKYLLELRSAGHILPYSHEQPQLRIVERSSTAFFDLYLKHLPVAAQRLLSAGSVPGVATLTARP